MVDSPDRPQSEIELKLTADPSSLKALRESPAFAGKAGRAVTRRLESVYYDTPDHRLHKRKLAFRVRKKGRQFVQTLKDEGDGMLRRGEWEAPVKSLEPDLDALPNPEPRERIGLILPDELQPVFASRIRRTTKLLSDKAGNDAANEIEIAFDDGVVESNGHSVPVAEVELELVRGSPEALYKLALELHELTPLKVEMRSKSARGYALAMGEKPGWSKAKRLTLKPDATVGQALEAVIRNCMDHWLQNETAAVAGEDPEGVHQMRVGLRRLRSALSLFAKAIPAQQLTWLKEETKWVASSLGPARDWDVFLASLLAPVVATRPDDSALAELQKASQSARAEGYDLVHVTVASHRYTRYMLRLGGWIEGAGWRQGGDPTITEWQDRPLVELADRLLSRRHKEVLKLGNGFADLPTERRHEVRIALKKLRYATEFFSSLYGQKKVKPYLRALSEMQDTIGHLNDVAVAGRLMDEVTAAARGTAQKRAALQRAAGTVIGWHEHGVTVLEPKIIADWHDFAHARPFWHKI